MAGAAGSTGRMEMLARTEAGGCAPLAAVGVSTDVTVAPLVGRPIWLAATCCWASSLLASSKL